MWHRKALKSEPSCRACGPSCLLSMPFALSQGYWGPMESLGAGQLTVTRSSLQCVKLTLTGNGKETPGVQEGRQGVGKAALGTRPSPQGPALPPQALCTKVPELIRTIMGWTLDFLRERLLGWIQDQGGWVRPLTPPDTLLWDPWAFPSPPQWCPPPPYPFSDHRMRSVMRFLTCLINP